MNLDESGHQRFSLKIHDFGIRSEIPDHLFITTDRDNPRTFDSNRLFNGHVFVHGNYRTIKKERYLFVGSAAKRDSTNR